MKAVTSILRRPVAALLAALVGTALLAGAAAAAPRKAEGGILFTYRDRAAKAVALAGEFNGWSPTANPMTRGDDELWSVVVPLKPGEQPYKFVVDGTWFADPENNVTAGEFGNSVVRIGAADHGLRYLTCSLCNTQWHAVRIKCVFCDTTKGIAYYGIEGGSAAVKAESCDACQGYLKILYMEKDPNVDALADDVASVALDVLMAESGITRHGVNFFLLGGSE